VIVLDTNVLSELMRSDPAPAVVEWTGSQPAASLFTTTITQAEILFGVELLAKGKRRDALAEAVADMFASDFRDRVLSFDGTAAHAFARIAAARRRLGRPISQLDAQIAAIAASRNASVATRNAQDFADCGVEVINPWQA
jgi:predicted nucleic acid-binding protein